MESEVYATKVDVVKFMQGYEMKLGKTFWDCDVFLSESARNSYSAEDIKFPYENTEVELTLLISCYNESEFIINTLNVAINALETARISHEIFIVDDKSTDNSRKLVSDYIANNPDKNIILRSNKFNKGLAENYYDIAHLGRGKYYRLMCGDDAELPESLGKLFNQIGEADIIIPYYTHVEGKPFFRRITTNAFTYIINLLNGKNIKYYNGLPIHLRQNVVRWHSGSRGFGFQADLLCRLLEIGFSYKEIPVTAVERRAGKSNALTLRNLLSVGHVLIEVAVRRLSLYMFPYK